MPCPFKLSLVSSLGHGIGDMLHNGLFHLISIHPLWMTFNNCPGGSKTNFNEGKGGILSKLDCVQG